MKNFKCKNSSCGVSFKADKLGPCPVCGSEITKEEKSNKLLIFSFLIIIIGIISIIILKPSIFSIENGQDISDDSIEQANDSTFINEKCYTDVRLNKPETNKSKNQLKVVFASLTDSCDYKYQVNSYTIQDSSLFVFDSLITDIEKFKISIYTKNDSLLINEEFTNPHYVKPTSSEDFDKYVSEFEGHLKTYLSQLKQDQESEYDSKLNKVFVKKMGLDADQTTITVNKNNSTNSTSLNALISSLEDDAYSDLYYTSKVDVDKDFVNGKVILKKFTITLNLNS
jgi:hypothetical protein